MGAEFNRLKVVLTEKKVKGKALASHLGVTETTVSRWCQNETQPSPEHFLQTAEYLDVDVRELIKSSKWDHDS